MEYDGAKLTSYAFAAEYKINDSLLASANVDQSKKRSGASGSNELTTSIIIIGFDFQLNEKSGISTSYGVKTFDINDNAQGITNSFTASYKKNVAGLNVYAQYANQSISRDVDVETDSPQQMVG